MGSTATVIVGDAEPELVDWAMRELERLEQSWSRFRPDSDLSLLNGSQNEWVAVPPLLVLALERAAQLWDATQGAFDPTILPALEAVGYDRSFDAMTKDDPAPPARGAVPGFDHVDLDAAAHRARLRGVRLDLGGIGKGLAADLIAEGLVDRGARSALVSLGGDMRVAGDAPEGGWMIPVERPDGSTWFTHPLACGALVQSTCSLRAWTRGGHRVHHIIDPRTTAPALTDVDTAVVAGAEAWWAEGFAKAAIILGRVRGLALLAAHDLRGWM